MVLTDCKQITKECSDQNILFVSNSNRQWRQQLSLQSLEQHSFDILRNPPPLLAERRYDNTNATDTLETGQRNDGEVIGRVYYVRGVPPTFLEDYWRWLQTPLSTSGAHKNYGSNLALFLNGGLLFWVAFEWLLYRKRMQARQMKEQENRLIGEAERLRQQLRVRLHQNSVILKQTEQTRLELEHTQQKQEAQLAQLHQSIAELRKQPDQHQQEQEQENHELNRVIELLNQQLQATENQKAENAKQLKTVEQSMKHLFQDKEEDTKKLQGLEAQLVSVQQEAHRYRTSLEELIEEMERPPLNPFELKILDFLQSSPNVKIGQWIVLSHLDVSQGKGYRQFTDFILITSFCIVVIEAKDYKGTIKAEGGIKTTPWFCHTASGHQVRINSSWGRNPYEQVNSYVDSIMRKLRSEVNAQRVMVAGMVVFPEGANLTVASGIGGFARVATLDTLIQMIEELETTAASRCRVGKPKRSVMQIEALLLERRIRHVA